MLPLPSTHTASDCLVCEFHALTKVLQALSFHLGSSQKKHNLQQGSTKVRVRIVNGLPALLIEAVSKYCRPYTASTREAANNRTICSREINYG
jgi:hypothetical protein